MVLAFICQAFGEVIQFQGQTNVKQYRALQNLKNKTIWGFFEFLRMRNKLDLNVL